eukprot:30924-Pelagococcus_subviridis.AAC.2
MNDASSVAGRSGAARRDRYSTIDSHGGFESGSARSSPRAVERGDVRQRRLARRDHRVRLRVSHRRLHEHAQRGLVERGLPRPGHGLHDALDDVRRVKLHGLLDLRRERRRRALRRHRALHD